MKINTDSKVRYTSAMRISKQDSSNCLYASSDLDEVVYKFRVPTNLDLGQPIRRYVSNFSS